MTPLATSRDDSPLPRPLPPPESLRDEAIALYEQLLDAWNRRDARAFAALFGASGLAIGFDGSQMEGETAIASELKAIFEHHQTAAYVASVRSVRPLGVDAALLHAVVGMAPPGSSAVKEERNAIQMVVAARQAGVLRIALLQNTPAAFHGRPELAGQLTAELNAVLRTGRTVASDEFVRR